MNPSESKTLDDNLFHLLRNDVGYVESVDSARCQMADDLINSFHVTRPATLGQLRELVYNVLGQGALIGGRQFAHYLYENGVDHLESRLGSIPVTQEGIANG